MKKIIAIYFLILSSYTLYSQPPGWVSSTDSIINFSFSLPTAPAFSDTLNISHYFSKIDSIGFQVLVIKSAGLDSSNTTFINYLQTTGGDTLMAIVNNLLYTTNSSLISSQQLTITNGYSGLEANLKYNTMVHGKNVVNIVRFYFKKNLLLTFSITGYEPDLSNITTNKSSFFNSINLNAEINY